MRRIVLSLVVVATSFACKKEAADAPVQNPDGAVESGGPSSQPAAEHHMEGKTGEAGEDHAEHAKMAGGREAVDADGVVRRGQKLSATEAITVSTAVTKSTELDGKSVKITGTVKEVCQEMGCWFVMQGEQPAQTIRITSKGHDIFVPKSAAGMTATVEGELKLKTLTKETAQHFEDERPLAPGEQRKVITADVKELSISVVGLEMAPAQKKG